ncbi:HIT family protein, partial [Nonlabens mediterrranea]|nr:HIT family protein [Nonlabens mediterrranea]
GTQSCVPKKEVNKIFDLDSETYFDLMDFSREVALALREEVTCQRIGMSVIGLEVPHVHVHLIPLRDMEDMRFSNKVSLSDEDMQDIATRVKARFDS